MAAIELWTNGAGMPSAFAQRARSAEADGWDGITIVDSQNLSGDCYVGLAVAAGETTRIRLGTGVTNPFTRHAAVTASAIATVHAVSGGRATLGIGRGDSALAHLGHAPASPEILARYLGSSRATFGRRGAVRRRWRPRPPRPREAADGLAD